VGKGESTLNVAFLSDIHVGPYKGEKWVRKLVERTNALKPDLVLLGGDFIYRNADDLPGLAPFKELKAPLGVYAILGNHDEWIARKEAKAWFETSGIPLLLNRSLHAEKDGRKISIAGADDDWYGETDLVAAFKDIAPDDLAVIMLHNPELAVPSAAMLRARPGPTFFFSGHTHGGQIRLPWWGPVPALPHHLGRRYDRGVFAFDGLPLVIGAGLGESGPRARLFCPPEIVVAELKY
jgi:predicted MPP superfamily phosphohydrolase